MFKNYARTCDCYNDDGDDDDGDEDLRNALTLCMMLTSGVMP